MLWTYSGSVVVLSWDLTHKKTRRQAHGHTHVSSHWPSRLVRHKHARSAPSAYETHAFAQRHKSDKNRPVNLACKLLLLPCHFCINFKMFSLNQQGDLLSAPPCNMTDWTCERHHVLRKSCTNSTGQMELARVDQPQVPDTVEKLLQVYKVESCQQQRRFSSCKHLSLVSFVNSVFSVFRQLRSEFWHHCLFLSLQFTLIVELLFSNMPPSITIYFNPPIHTLSLHNSFRWFHILHL